MAKLNSPRPGWLRAEVRQDFHDMFTYAEIGVRCSDGWVHLMHAKIDYHQSDDVGIRKKRRELLQEQLQHLTMELAKLTLEET